MRLSSFAGIAVQKILNKTCLQGAVRWGARCADDPALILRCQIEIG